VGTRVIFFRALAVFIISTAVCSRADVIHLKNGRKIWADHVRENGTRLEYDVGDDSYAIPRSSVESIEAGGLAPAYAASSGNSGSSKELPSLNLDDTLSGHEDLASKIVHDGKVDDEVLRAIEKEGKGELTATAYFLAGKHNFEHGNLPQAKRYFETALRFQPANSTILNYYAMALLRSGNPTAALPYAQQSARANPNSPDAYTVLGFAEFSADRTKEAIRDWKRSLQLRPDSVVEQFLAKAQREATTEADFSQSESSHFTLHYEGRQTSEMFRRELIATLESQYDDLVRQLGVSPRASISVTLYTEQAFFDVTHAPSWSGAVNDGKLRIPISGLTSMNSDLARVLKHELAHSFVNQASGGRCPTWLNEGIAQAMEPKNLASNGRRLSQLFQAQQEIPYNALEGSFMRFSPIEALLAYDESLAAVEYINETYGVSDIQRLMQRLSEGSSTEAALRATLHSDYRQLESDVAKFLSSKYGQ
jgi:tetratricopeptide (TPR) repeat protein